MTNKLKQLLGLQQGKESIRFNMLASGITKPISIVISYIYVPIVLSYLGIEKYGVWATILSILSWIGYFDIGIGNGLRNRLTESITKKEDRRSRILVSSAYVFIAIIMIIASLVFFGIANILDWNSIFGVKGFDENLTQIVCVSVAFVAVNFILSICKNIFYALQEVAYVSLMELIVQIANLVGVLIVSRFYEGNLLLMAVVYGTSMVSVSLVFSIILYAKRKFLRPSFKMVQLKTGKELTNLGLQFFVIQICALVLFTTDNLIISHLYGASDVTPYTTVNKLFSAVSQGYMALLVPIWSSVTKAKTENNFVWLKLLIRKLHLLMLPFVVVAVVLTIIFIPLSTWWLGQELNYVNGLIPLGAIYCILTIWCNTYAYVANGLELMKISMKIAITQAIANIPLSLFFAKTLGMESAGVLLGTVLVMVISAILTPIYVMNRIQEGIVISVGEVDK